MFFRARRRRKLFEKPITDAERQLASQSLWQFPHLPAERQDELIRRCRVLLSEKHWEGCRGFEVTEEVKWTVAAAASLCIPLGADWYFDKTSSVLIYPSGYVAKYDPGVNSHFELGGEFARSGETLYRGPVIVNWDDVLEASRGPNDGNSLAIHEFSHQLDLVNGPHADGLPPLPVGVDPDVWFEAMQLEFSHARKMVHRGHNIYMDDYGLSELSEFFSVGSEHFFQTPHDFAYYHPGVFDRLAEFYRVDPREWLPDKSKHLRR